MSQTPREVVTAFLNCETFEDAACLIADDVSIEDWFAPERNYKGRDALFEKILIPSATAFEEGSYVYPSIIEDGARVALRGTFSAKFVRSYHGYRPTQSMVAWNFHDFFEVHDGVITSMVFGSDTLSVHRALTAS
jgi:predicted ester cyclase